jgi:Mg-chelatase subunit ChlD
LNHYWTTFACIALAAYRPAAAAEPAHFRAACFDTHKLPKVVVPLDVKRTQSGWPVLNADGFHLVEDRGKTSAADRIGKFRDSNMGLALIVALDASGSMKGRPMAAIQKGLAQLVSRKRPEDRVEVLSFADDTRWETRWDTSDQATQDAFRNLQTRGNLTRLYDAVEDANNEFARQAGKDEAFPLRRCILIISDGHDEGSQIKLTQLLNDIGTSRVRLDAVGLAHSPLWLGSLRQLARAGFGEFQPASSPEDLTNLLGQGIDSLLDMPTLEFQAEHLRADGETHQVGIEYGATAVRDQVSLRLPEPFWRTKRALYFAAGGLALLIICVSLVWRLRSPKAASQPSPAPLSQPLASPPPVPPPLRAATVAEPGSRVMRPAQTVAPFIGYAEPSYTNPPPQARTSVNPARVPTALAPYPATASARLSLTAIAGPCAGQTFPITEQEFWIGSAANNHLCMGGDESVSGNHVCLRTEQSIHRLYDNGSLNNTWVNGRAIGREVTVIQPGDRIRVGASDFVVEANGDA